MYEEEGGLLRRALLFPGFVVLSVLMVFVALAALWPQAQRPVEPAVDSMRTRSQPRVVHRSLPAPSSERVPHPEPEEPSLSPGVALAAQILDAHMHPQDVIACPAELVHEGERVWGDHDFIEDDADAIVFIGWAGILDTRVIRTEDGKRPTAVLRFDHDEETGATECYREASTGLWPLPASDEYPRITLWGPGCVAPGEVDLGEDQMVEAVAAGCRVSIPVEGGTMSASLEAVSNEGLGRLVFMPYEDRKKTPAELREWSRTQHQELEDVLETALADPGHSVRSRIELEKWTRHILAEHDREEEVWKIIERDYPGY